MSQYVQHISGQGEKFLITDYPDPIYPTEAYWRVVEGALTYWLPRGEYRLCEPPEQWVDVTEQCVTGTIYQGIAIGTQQITGSPASGYRLRKIRIWIDGTELGQAVKVQQWAFIVERKEP